MLTEPTDWIGGQLTSQAVPPDEHPWIEQFGSQRRSYRALRDGIRDYYRRHYPLTAEALAEPGTSTPAAATSRRSATSPRVALAVLTAMLAPYASTGRLLAPAGARAGRRRGPTATASEPSPSATCRTGDRRALVAPYFLDATELGDLLPLAGVEHVIGAESQAQTGEPHAPETAQPLDPAGVHLLLRRSSTATARTTRSTGPPSTPSGATTSPS